MTDDLTHRLFFHRGTITKNVNKWEQPSPLLQPKGKSNQDEVQDTTLHVCAAINLDSRENFEVCSNFSPR